MPITNYIWDVVSDNVLMEKDGAGATTAVYTNEPVQYGKLISQRRGSTTSYYHFDAQGSARQLTDQDETATDEYSYTAFGETVARTGTMQNSFGYKGALGYYYGSCIGRIYVRARFLIPNVGRWLSIDPIAFPKSFSRFVYAGNNPISRGDPSGLISTHLRNAINQAVPLVAGAVSRCGDSESTEFFDRINMTSQDVWKHYYGPAVGSLEASIEVRDNKPKGRCGTKDLLIISSFEATSVWNGKAFHSTASLIQGSTLRVISQSMAGCTVTLLPPYPTSSSPNSFGIGAFEICHIPCKDGQCQELSANHIIWAVDKLGSHQTRPGQMALWQWRFCPKTAECCTLSTCMTLAYASQLVDGWNYNTLDDSGNILQIYQGPPYGRPHPGARIGQEPTPNDVADMVRAHGRNRGVVLGSCKDFN